MTSPNLSAAVALLSKLTTEEKRALNHILVDQLRVEHKVNAVVAGSQFNTGDIVSFVKSGRGRNAGIHYIKIEGRNRAGTALVGRECSRGGESQPFSVKWTVAPTLVTLVKKS